MELSGVLAQWLMPANCTEGYFVTSWNAAAIDKIRGPDKQRFIDMLSEMGRQSAEVRVQPNGRFTGWLYRHRVFDRSSPIMQKCKWRTLDCTLRARDRQTGV